MNRRPSALQNKTRKRAPRSREPGELSNREALIRAAINEFSQKGYEGATTSGIARAANLAQPMVFRHFGTKEDLWDATIERLMSPILQMASSVFEGLSDLEPKARMKFLLRQFVLLSARYPEISRVMVREGVSNGPRLKVLIKKYVKPLVDPLQGLAEQGVEEGWLKPLDLNQLLFIVIGAATHFFNVPGLASELVGVDSNDHTAIDRHVETMMETVFHGILKTPDQGRRAR